MGGSLSAFMAQNAEKQENIKYVASQRFKEDGKPIEWEIRSLTTAEDEAIKKGCYKTFPVPGKKNQFKRELDTTEYIAKISAACTVHPNLHDAELQNSYGVMGSEALLKAMLTPGEYTNYILKVQEVNGFDVSMDDLVEEAKNL